MAGLVEKALAVSSFVTDRFLSNHQKAASSVKKHVTDNFKKVARPTDSFKPSFAVPPNPGHVRLDYNASKDGNPDSNEAWLKAAVLRDTTSPASSSMLPATTSVLGMSGTGKSCAAKGLADDADIKKRFPGGVYLMSLGKDANTRKVADEIRKTLWLSGGAQVAQEILDFKVVPDSLYAIVDKAKAHFERFDCLFLIDDLRIEDDISTETLRQLARLAECSKKSHVVYTTISPGLASLAWRVSFRELETYGKKAQDILLRAAGFEVSEVSENARKYVNEILGICNGLPVGLAVAGKAVRLHAGITAKDSEVRNEAWKSYFTAYVYSNPGEIVHPKTPGLGQSLLASLNVLQSKWKEAVHFQTAMSVPQMFTGLCVLRQQEWVPVEILRKLWKLRKDEEAEVVVSNLEEMSLVNVNTKSTCTLSYTARNVRIVDKPVTFVQLHDLVHEFACAMAKGREQKMDKQGWHRHLLREILPHNTRSRKCGFRKWWKCDMARQELEGYVKKLDVEYHLKGAGLEEELSLLRKEHRWHMVTPGDRSGSES